MAGAENDSEVVKASVENGSSKRINAPQSDTYLLGHSVRDH